MNALKTARIAFVAAILGLTGHTVPVVAKATSLAPDPTARGPGSGLREKFVEGKNGGRDRYIATRGDVTGTASTALSARMIQAEAEYLYRRASLRWLNREPPPGWMPVYAWHARVETHLPRASISTDKNNRVVDAEIAIVGNIETAPERQLPREMARLVFARHFHDALGDRPRPNWVRFGAPVVDTLDTQEQVYQFDQFQEYLKRGQTVPLSELCDPQRSVERNIVLAQGYSLTRFLLTIKGRPSFIRFVESGVRDDWNMAAKETYDFKSLDALEAAWLEWAKKPDSRPAPLK